MAMQAEEVMLDVATAQRGAQRYMEFAVAYGRIGGLVWKTERRRRWRPWQRLKARESAASLVFN